MRKIEKVCEYEEERGGDMEERVLVSDSVADKRQRSPSHVSSEWFGIT